MTSVPRAELVGRIANVLREERADVVVTFGPDGITAHPDHIRVGDATTEAFHRLRAEGGDGFRRLLYACMPESMIVRANEMLVAAGEEPFDPTRIYHPRGVPDETIGVRVDCSAVWRRNATP